MTNSSERPPWTFFGLRVEGWIAILAFSVSLYAPIRDFLARPILSAVPAEEIEIWYNGPELKNWSMTAVIMFANSGREPCNLAKSTIELEKNGDKWEFYSGQVATRVGKQINNQFVYHIDPGEIQSPVFLSPSTSKNFRYVFHTKRNASQPLEEGTYNFRIYGFLGTSRTKMLLSQDTLQLSKDEIELLMSNPMHRRMSWLQGKDG